MPTPSSPAASTTAAALRLLGSLAVTAALTAVRLFGLYLDVIFLNKLDEVYLIKHSCHYNTQA